MKDVRQRIKDYIEERNWGKVFKNPSNLAKSVSIEAAELLEMFQWRDHSVEHINENEKLKDDISKELADVFIYCTQMAIALNLDVEEIMNNKLDHLEKKYPAEKVKDNSDNYYQIKQDYRENA
jgi:NTP pyrophosphatase (non-canonical NTP hydrolase)